MHLECNLLRKGMFTLVHVENSQHGIYRVNTSNSRKQIFPLARACFQFFEHQHGRWHLCQILYDVVVLGGMCRCVVYCASKCPFWGSNYKVLNWPLDMQIIGWQWVLTWEWFCYWSDRSSIRFDSCGEIYLSKCVNGRKSFSSWRMLWTVTTPWRGLWLVGNEILLLLSRKRISKDNRCLTRIFLGKVIHAFLKMRTMPSYMIFKTEFAWIVGAFILFHISRCNGLLFRVGLLRWLLLKRSGLIFFLLVLATGFLCRLHRGNCSGRKSSRFGRGVHYQLGNKTTELFYNDLEGCFFGLVKLLQRWIENF